MISIELSPWLMTHAKGVASSLVLVAIGWPVLRITAGLVRRWLKNKASLQSGMLAFKIIRNGGLIIIGLTVMHQLGFKLTTLLGAAGIMGVAIGFASQTSLSNLISGLFLLGEQPFAIGDVLQVGQTVGTVTSVDLLSCKLRTFDNKFVRIPNELLIKTEFTNITRYKIRRYDLAVGVAYKEDIERVIKVLRDIADKNPFCLDEPEPVVIFTGFADSSINFNFGVWFAREDFAQLRNTLAHDLKKRFDAEGIEIPFPHRTIYTGSVTEPMPIQMVAEPKRSGDGT